MNPLNLKVVSAFAAYVARANDLVAFGDLPFSDHAIAAQKNPEPAGYAARIQLVSKGKLVDEGKCPPGEFAIIDGDTVTPLGKEIDVVPLAVLDKALDTSGDEVVVAFGRDNATYQEIAERSTEKDSGCMFGPCFLVLERTHGTVFEIFLNNKSGRSEAKKLYPFLPVGPAQAKAHGVEARAPKACQIKSKYIKKPRYSWFAPQVVETKATFDKTPSKEVAIAAVKNFLKQAEVEDEGRDR